MYSSNLWRLPNVIEAARNTRSSFCYWLLRPRVWPNLQTITVTQPNETYRVRYVTNIISVFKRGFHPTPYLWCKFITKPRKSFSTFILSNRVGCPYYITVATFIIFLSNFWYQINVSVAGVWMRNGGVWRFCPCCYPLGVEGGVRRATQRLHPFE